MKRLLILLCMFITLGVHAQFHGTVFNDANGNGKFDPGELSIKDIRVSDGLNVVLTDKSGAFILPGYEKTRFLFITTPAGYRVSQQNYLPVHGKEKSYDFGLVQDNNTLGNTIRMLQITDTETFLFGEWINNIRNYAGKQHAAFIVHTGDICYEKGLNFHAVQVNAQVLQKPIYYAVGNHDLVKGSYGEAMFESLFGPPYYSFDAGPGHFIITPMASGDFKPDYTTDQVIAWLRNDLSHTDKNKPVFIFNHNLPFQSDEFILKGKNDSINLEKYGLKAWIYGHWHSDFVKKSVKNGIYTICTDAPNKGGIDNSLGRFLAIDVDSSGIKKIEARYPYLKEHVVITQPGGTNMNVLKTGRISLSANIYDTEKKIDKVSATIYDRRGNRIATQLLLPFGDWNWRGEAVIPNAQQGNYTVEVEVGYANGEYTIKKQSFILGRPAPGLQVKWSSNISGNVWKAAPLLAANLLFVGTIDDAGGQRCGVTALDAGTGRIIWKFTTRNSVKNALSYENGILLATDEEGFVYAFEGKSGKLRWKKDMGIACLPGNLIGGVADKGIYYTGFGKYLQAIRIADGETIWKNSAWETGMGSPAQMTVAGDVLVTGSNWNALFGQDIKTGKLLWKRDDDGLRYRSSKATYQDGVLYVTGLSNLFVLDPKTGRTIKKTATPDDGKVTAAPLIIDKLVILSTSANGVAAYDKNTLQQVWHTSVGNALIFSAPYSSPDDHRPIGTVEPTITDLGGKLLFGASDGYVYVLNKNNGRVIQKISLGAPIFAEACLGSSQYYIADFGGTIYCFGQQY
jgi:outer membrane protein assembly factor BamB